MNDGRILVELRLLEQRLPGLMRRAVEDALQSRLDPAQRQTVDLLAELFGDGPGFETRHLWQQLQLDVHPRPALRRVLSDQGAVDRQGVGQCLLQIARAGGRSGPWRLLRNSSSGNRARWQVQRAEQG